jgi:predicted amidohydrolase
LKIAVAQTRPVTGDIQRNIGHHINLIDLATSNGAECIIFPELSLTGYEPRLAKELATDADDKRFNDLQRISDAAQITIGVGVPTKNNGAICISLIIFQPYQSRLVYSKKYLHPDEDEFFVSGQNFACLNFGKTNIAIAICYELSVPEHAENAHKEGGTIYIASVAKSAEGVEKASKRLAAIAQQYSMTVLMSNSVGYCDNFQSAGKTGIWNSKGLLVSQLNSESEGILIVDIDTQEINQRIL